MWVVLYPLAAIAIFLGTVCGLILATLARLNPLRRRARVIELGAFRKRKRG